MDVALKYILKQIINEGLMEKWKWIILLQEGNRRKACSAQYFSY